VASARSLAGAVRIHCRKSRTIIGRSDDAEEGLIPKLEPMLDFVA
jgi:hypothetical protein